MNLEEYLAQHYASRSRRAYLRLIERYHLAVHDPVRASYQEVMDYLGALRKMGLHSKSVRNHLAAIKIYYRYLVASEQASPHPCLQLTLRDQLNRAVELEALCTPQQLEELEMAFATASLVARIIVSLLVNQALTTGEIRALRTDDIEDGQITIREQDAPVKRTNRGRTLALTDQQKTLFADYLEQRSDVDHEALLLTPKGLPLWPGFINRLFKRHPVGRHFQPQRIRQSVIANLLKSGHDLRVVQAFAGHRRTASTEQYQSGYLEELRSAIQKYHPLQ